MQVLENAIVFSDNTYNIPNTKIKGRACKTNLPSNTAFRGMGKPEGMMIMEQVMETVSRQLKLSAADVRELNIYHEGDTTPCGMVLNNCTIRRCWAQLKETSSFSSRRTKVDQFNQYVRGMELF